MNEVNEASPANKVSDVARVVMRYPADNTKEPVYLIIQACTVDRCLSAMQQYLDEHGVGCGLGPVVSDLTLMATGARCAMSMLESERAASKWKPIETATKANGNRILVWDADNEIAATAQWDEFRNRWRADDYDTPNTTHWMPLPAPPAGV